MEWVTNLLTDTGAASLDIFWLPVGLWTVIALLAAGFLKLFEHKLSPVYHYHSRVALLWGLAAGIIGSILLYVLPSASTGTVATAKFIVIQNPISVTATAPAASLSWGDPMLWAGVVTLCVLIITALALCKLLADIISLYSFSRNLSRSGSDFKKKLSPANKHLLFTNRHNAAVYFSDQVAVPCTYGWFRKHIVLPQHLSHKPEKLNMALRHELTHIANNDFLINGTVQTVRALFFFHPLVHILAADIEEYREMYCDQHVLQDAEISQKNYAELLFELAPSPVFKTSAAVNMAVNPSTLKKRIQTMKNATPSLPSLKWSLSFMLAIALMVSGLMACSDIEENGITKSEVEDVQANMDKAPDHSSPLFILNGEKMDEGYFGRLKPEYIESIEVFKGQEAIEKYGEAGKNGVVHIKLIDKEKALSDLRTDEEMSDLKDQVKKPADPSEDFYVAVQDPPKIKGGMESIMKDVTYPKECREAQVQGRVTVQFIVNKKGKPEAPQIIRGIGNGCDEEALRVVKQAEFEPGLQRGQPVRVQMALPIVFRLQGDNKETSENISPTKDAVNRISLDELTVTSFGGGDKRSALQFTPPPVSDQGIIQN